MIKHCYNAAEVAAALGIGRNAAYDLIHRGDFPSLRVGARWVVPVAAFERGLEEQARREGDSNAC